MTKFFARKTVCHLGHNHASKREAARCAELTQMLQAGLIEGIAYEPKYEFLVEGRALKMLNGRTASYRPDFVYIENGKLVAEDVKAKNGFMSRDVPLRMALFRHMFPQIELRVVT